MLGTGGLGSRGLGGVLEAAGVLALQPALYVDSDVFFSALVAPGTITLNPSLFADGDLFFSATLTLGTTTLHPSLFADNDIFFAPVVVGGQSFGWVESTIELGVRVVTTIRVVSILD